jgi:hypothetical protein
MVSEDGDFGMLAQAVPVSELHRGVLEVVEDGDFVHEFLYC